MLHKGSVRAVAFSPDGSLLATLGGVDDNSVVVWNAETGAAVCGSPAGSHAALTLRWFNNSNTTLVTAGSYNLKLWELDVDSRRVGSGGMRCVFATFDERYVDEEFFFAMPHREMRLFGSTTARRCDRCGDGAVTGSGRC